MMLGTSRPITRSTAAARHIKIASRSMRPGILHGRGQCDRLALDQLRARGVNIVVREIGSHIRIERDLVRRRLGRRQFGHGNAACDKRQERSAGEHSTPPSGQLTSRWYAADNRYRVSRLSPNSPDVERFRLSGLPRRELSTPRTRGRGQLDAGQMSYFFYSWPSRPKPPLPLHDADL